MKHFECLVKVVIQCGLITGQQIGLGRQRLTLQDQPAHLTDALLLDQRFMVIELDLKHFSPRTKLFFYDRIDLAGVNLVPPKKISLQFFRQMSWETFMRPTKMS